MKTTNLFLTSLFIGLIFSLNGQNQNPAWSLPPYFAINDGQGFTSSTLPTSYTANNASNMQLDANGEILFYVIGNAIHDSDGDLIEQLESFYASTYPTTSYCMSHADNSEIVIIPDPTNCGRYYILASSVTYSGCNQSGVSSFPIGPDPYVAILDFNVVRPNNSSKLGAITSVERVVDLPSMPPFLHSWQGSLSGGVLMAASQLKEVNGKKFRYMFIAQNTIYSQDPKGIVRFKIGGNGMEYDGFIPFEYQNSNGGSRSEMELIELPNGRYRIACPYGSTYSHNGLDLSSAIYTAELDANGVIFPGSEKTLQFYRNGNIYDGPFIHGIEFSPDGSKLFISHDISFYHPKPVEYYDFNNPNLTDPNGNGIYSLDIASTLIVEEDFQNSHIELATDGSIYFGADERLASLSFPNSPNVNNFIDNVVSLPNYHANYGGYGAEVSKLLKTYTLPDQIDGMNYQNFAPTVYNATSYTATSGTWQAGNGSNPWNSVGDVFIENELIIPSGKNVTIQNMTFRFGPDAKVIIEQGAKLTIDGTTFTNSRPCNNEEQYWQGVEVYGTSNQHQFPVNNPTHQGMLELKNGGTIENAHLAFTNWNPESWSEIGGVIKSTDGVFRNNRRGVEFMAYQNFTPNYPGYFRNNTSSFTDTEFLTNDDFVEGYPQQPYVTLWKVHGIIFENCHFANNVTTNKSLSSSPNEGISTLDASFKVVPRCDSPPLPQGQPCPAGLLLKSSFDGLEYAIQVAGAGVTEAVTISQTDFTNNIWGIRVKEFDNVNINRNDFVIGNGGYSNSTYSGNGIFLDNSVEYIVEENSVLNTLSSGKTSGIVVDYGGPLDIKVYKNTLSNLFEGTKSNRVNRSVDLKYGLQFLCNDLHYMTKK